MCDSGRVDVDKNKNKNKSSVSIVALLDCTSFCLLVDERGQRIDYEPP